VLESRDFLMLTACLALTMRVPWASIVQDPLIALKTYPFRFMSGSDVYGLEIKIYLHMQDGDAPVVT